MENNNQDIDFTDKYSEIFSNFFSSLRTVIKYSEDYSIVPTIITHSSKSADIKRVENIIKARIELSLNKISEKEFYDKLNNLDKSDYLNNLIEYNEEEEYYFSNDPYVRYCIHTANTFNSQLRGEQKKMLQMSFLNIVNLFETVISNLAIQYYLDVHQSDDLYRDAKVSFSDIKNFQNMEDIREYIITRKIIDIMYKPFVEWFKKLISEITRLGKSYFEEINDEVEIIKYYFNVRNIILHNQGKTNYEFIKNTQTESYKIGEEISITINDIEKLSKSIYKISSRVIIEYITKIKKSLNINYKILINDLNTAAIELINDGRYFHAEILLQDIKKFGALEEDSVDWRIIFYNLLLSSKLSESDKFDDLYCQYEEIVNSHQTLGLEDFFAIHIFKFNTEPKYNIQSLIDIIDEMVGNKYELVNILFSWPMFKLLEKNDDFLEYKEKILYSDAK